ncbi:MAG: nickel pincer cofactor biosynthesis protein LarB [Pseudanabaenaceae cyanobacterium bins.68]|nr:nickel pincer cofactor biosynthesis protein LarB [Pseudanabaenaceae cyanobacterium bins.68]
MNEELLNLLQAVADQKISAEVALRKLKHFDFEPLGEFAKLDHHRSLRTGFPEVVFGQGKTAEQMLEIMRSLQARTSQNFPVVIATRVSPQVYAQIKPQLPGLNYVFGSQLCYLGEPRSQPGTVTLIAAGTADLPVAEEAAITAELCGFQVKRLWDVGVAGIHRLMAHKYLIQDAEVIIAIAGMEGALPSVVGGLADCPVIAVPTSVGYGASFQGLAPLLGMLNSCAAGIGVVNIDNGFGAAILAAQILRLAHKKSS